MWVRFSGIVGAVVFLFGFVASFLVGKFDQKLLVAHMLIGAGLLLFWLFMYGFKNIEQAGQVLKGRTTRFGANALLYSVVFVGILITIYYIMYKHDQRWDLTENSVYSLSEQSLNVIKGVKKPPKIIAFKGIAQMDEIALKDLLDLYKSSNTSLIETRLIDAQAKPHLLDQYEMKPGNLVYLEYGEDNAKGVSRINESNEQAISNAIIKLTRGDAKKVYYVEGHDEPDIAGDDPQALKLFAGAIADEHLTIAGILLSQQPKIPDDAAAVILCSPKKPLLPEEKKVLTDYADSGGRLLLFGDPRTTDDIKDLAAHFNIEVGNNVVIDQVQRLFAAPSLGAQPVVREYGAHAITKNMKARDVTVFNIASSVSSKGKNSSNETYTDLAKTGASAWAETDLNRLFDQEESAAVFDNGVDIGGPVSLAVAYEKKINSPEEGKDSKDQPKFQKTERVVVFGDSDWILNVNFAVYSNRDLVLSALNWLVGEEGGISIAKRGMRTTNKPILSENFLFLLAVSFLIPEFILLFGLFVWWRRKTVRA